VVLAAASLAVIVPRAEAHAGAPGLAKHTASGHMTRADADADADTAGRTGVPIR
jgi:hypothetical protein